MKVSRRQSKAFRHRQKKQVSEQPRGQRKSPTGTGRQDTNSPAPPTF
jgi:hypothetical protein